MAQVFRPHYYVNPKNGKRTGAKTPGAVMKKSKTWWVRYYLPNGERRKVKGYTDKKATQTYAAELERRGVREDAGVFDPTDAHAKTPLTKHAADYVRSLAGKGNVDRYVATVEYRLTSILDSCRFVRIGDVQASAVGDLVARLRREGTSIKTANDSLATIKGFTRWLWRDKRTATDPLVGMSRLAASETNLRHARRDLSADELGLLLDATRTSRRTVCRLGGRDRYFLYLTAAATGFRVSDLASLTPESFDLDGPTPTATVQAACTKNRKKAVQPLPVDVAKIIREYLTGKPAGVSLWAGTWRVKAARMIRADLAAARQAWLSVAQEARRRAERKSSDFLAYCDAEGRYADFHSLRHGYITMVGKAGVSPKEHQDLARHSTYALTSRYSHSRFYDLSAAVQSLPIPLAGPLAPEALRATGTDGKAQNSLGPNLGPQPAN
jgi:site-specific recombinase XerD